MINNALGVTAGQLIRKFLREQSPASMLSLTSCAGENDLIILTDSKIRSDTVLIFSDVRPASWDTIRFSIGYSDFKMVQVSTKKDLS